jgi:hypothetical protein
MTGADGSAMLADYRLLERAVPHVVITIAMLTLAGTALADATSKAGACYTLAGDARTACLAKAHNDPGMCYALMDPAKRALCLSEVRK